MTEPLDPIIAGLNPQQAEAVLTTEGPVLILAGAGSGKTRVLTHRIAYLIKTMGVTSSSILAVTFTNKAAGEMKERVIRLLQGKDSTQSSGPELPATDGDDTPLELPTMGTFHSVCCQILRREIEHLGRASNFVIFDTLDQVSLVRSLLKELAPNTNLTPKAVLSAISKGKNDMLSEVELRNKLGGDYFADIVVSVYPRYQQALKENEALDFDDLLMRTAFLLRLRGGRMMPLNFMTFQYQNGRTFMEAFLRLNTAKIVGPESYTQAEMRKLGVAGLNRMVRV